MAVQHARKLFTVDQYHKMAEAGILSEDDHVELIEGEIINMSPINSVHGESLSIPGFPDANLSVDDILG